MDKVVRSAARVLDILEYFASLEGSTNLTNITTVFEMPKSSAFGLLRTLCARGYLVRDDQGLYSLNSYFRKHGFGWGSDHVARWSAVIEPAMERLAAETGETVILGEFVDRGEVRLLKQSLTAQPIRYSWEDNYLFPVYCTAMGRILLSKMSDSECDRILDLLPRIPRTPHTVTDKDQIQMLVAKARADGFCLVSDETDLGGTGVATWISAAPGLPFIALNVSCISARFPAKRDQVIAALLREATGLRELMVPKSQAPH